MEWLIDRLILGLILGLTLSLTIGLVGGLILGLTLGLIVGLIFGLVNGLKTDISIRVKPNQGVRSSLKNTLIIAALCIPILMLIRIGMPYVLRNILGNDSLIFRITLVAPATLLWAGIFHSIQVCIQHFSLRLVLYQTNIIPWNYARFLNHCTDRLLLQRVGGRYRFIHRLVQEHFAAMPLEQVK